MAYVVPPTFADTNALSASQLNVLSSDIEYLNGITGGPQIAAPQMYETGGATWLLFFRYLHRYIHFGWVTDTPTGTGEMRLEIYNPADTWYTVIKDRSPSGASEDIVADLHYVDGGDGEFKYFDVGVALESTTNQTGDDGIAALTGWLVVGTFYQLRVTSSVGGNSTTIPWVINADGVTL